MMSSTSRTSRPSMRGAEVLEDADQARRFGRQAAVGGHLHEVDPDGDRDRPHQVGHERQRALEHAHEGQLAAGVVGADLAPELRDLRRDLLLAQQHLLDVGREVGDAHSSVTPRAEADVGRTAPAPPSGPRSGRLRRDVPGSFRATGVGAGRRIDRHRPDTGTGPAVGRRPASRRPRLVESQLIGHDSDDDVARHDLA